jgi:hypothetical protein
VVLSEGEREEKSRLILAEQRRYAIASPTAYGAVARLYYSRQDFDVMSRDFDDNEFPLGVMTCSGLVMMSVDALPHGRATAPCDVLSVIAGR